MTNPAALALALLLGHEARITDEQWSEVRAMECPNCEAMDWPNLPDGSYTCSACHRTYYLRTSGVRTALPQVTHHCPNCEAAARERDAAYEDARQMQERLQRLIDAEPQRELADLRTQIEALANEMETAERGVRLQYWIISLRKIAERGGAGENGMDILDRAIDRIEEHSWTQDGPMSDEDDAAIDLLKECMEAVERELLAEKEAK